jgi:hypothetical protein
MTQYRGTLHEMREMRECHSVKSVPGLDQKSYLTCKFSSAGGVARNRCTLYEGVDQFVRISKEELIKGVVFRC